MRTLNIETWPIIENKVREQKWSVNNFASAAVFLGLNTFSRLIGFSCRK